jgi:N-acetylmuramoyl-L-alanine amidase
VLQAPFVVLLEAEMPAVLVEVGFLSNPEECEQIAAPNYQAQIAQALSTAIISHLAKFKKAEKQANLVSLP